MDRGLNWPTGNKMASRTDEFKVIMADGEEGLVVYKQVWFINLS